MQTESTPKKSKTPTGLRLRHSRSCKANAAGRCNCSPSVEAWAFDKRTGKKLRKTFTGAGAIAAAKGWRADATGAVRRGTLKPASSITLREAAEAWLEGARAGAIRNRSGDLYKPSVIYSYERALKLRVLDELGAAKLGDITRTDVQDRAERLQAEGLDPSTVRNAIMPLRVILGRALKRGEIAVNPTAALDLPAVRGRRDRIVDPVEASELLEALTVADRALWATAIYAGLRRGELLALRWDDVDLAAGVIRVERSYDPRSGKTTAPKSAAGARTVPIIAVLRDYLLEHKLAGGEGLVFARSDGGPFTHSAAIRRARTAWKNAAIEKARKAGATDEEIAALRKAPFDALTLHEGRHSFASMMIAAGWDVKELSVYMGHSSIAITFDRYGHLMPGNQVTAAKKADEYLARADTGARLSQLGGS